jgi:hemerythrin-like domain-containing protein
VILATTAAIVDIKIQQAYSAPSKGAIRMAEDQQNTAPSAVLRDEHKTILRVLDVLEKITAKSDSGGGLDIGSSRRCVEFFRLFADACHHAKEEDLLFPVLEQRGIPREGGPIGVMLYEHTVGRELTRKMGEAVEALDAGDASGEEAFRAAARQYLELLRNHIFKEDNILFTMGDRVMSENDQSDLCGKFCEVGCRAFEGKKREELARIADELETEWGG